MLLSKLLALLPILPLALGAPHPAKHSKPSGVVTTNGKQFELDGRPFCFLGINAYWIPQLVKESQFRAAFDRMQSVGVKVLRTWAFSMITARPEPGYDLTYYQYWNGSSYTINDGANGLERLDMVVKLAEEYDIKLILTFANNWDDYGGVNMYLEQITGNTTYHSDFFDTPAVIEAYERYVKTIVQRYKHSSAIFSWELFNEPRSTDARPGFTPDDLTKWIADRSAFIKHLDPHHMVSVGDEGYFNWPNSTNYVYNGGSGGDFEATLKLPNIDFGTYHQYYQTWATDIEWGYEWTQAHANAMNEIGKPVIMEEFNVEHWDNQATVLPKWLDKVLEVGLPGILPWQLGAEGLDISGSTVWIGAGLDSMDMVPEKADVWALFKDFADKMNERCPSGNTQPTSVSQTPTSSAATSTSTSTCKPVRKRGQCGGIKYKGCKTCEAGSTCTYSNDWYSQCL